MVKHLLRVNYTCLAMLLSLLLIGHQSVWADGSKDMYPSDYYARYGVTSGSAGDYRACLLSGITSSGSDPDVAAPFPTFGTIKVYAKAGEHIYVASSAMKVKNALTRESYGRIDWRAPNGKSGSVTNVRRGGLIANRAQELAGPNINGSTRGYNAYQITVAADQEGVWEIDFIGATTKLDFSSETTSNHRIESWTEDQNLPYINAFDVSVSNKEDNAFIPGRVYANVLNLLMPSAYGGTNYNCEWYTTLYVLTNTGYLYEVKPNGQNGHFSTFFANNKGVQINPEGWVTDNSDFSASKALGCYGGLPAYASLTSELTGNQFKNQRVPTFDPRRPDRRSTRVIDGEERVTDDITHKIFFTKPASDLPASARAVYGKQVVETWLLSDLNAKDTPTLTNLNIVGKESNKKGIMGPEGVNLFFEANAAGDYLLEMTFGEGYTNRTFAGVCQKGENVIEWDGKDGAGRMVPVVDIVLAGKLKTAEIHFPFFDLENNKKGLILNQLSADWSSVERDTIYWDDSKLGVAKGAAEDALDMTKGTKSPGHIWLNRQSDRGNNRIIDTWTYAQGASGETQSLSALSLYIDLSVNSVNCDAASTHVGEEISYTMEIENRAVGEYTFKGESVQVSADADSASFGVWFADGGFHMTQVELVSSDDPTCAVKRQPSGDEFGMGYISLKNGKRATVRVKGYVDAKMAHQKVQPLGFVMRPGDFFEIDANNLASDGMPLDPAAEYEGMSHNNLVEVATPLFVLNSAPEPGSDDALVAAGQMVEGNLLSNDMDPDQDAMTIIGCSLNGTPLSLGVANDIYQASVMCGSLLVKGDGSYAFTAHGDYSGQVPDIDYEVSDQFAGSGAIATTDLTPGVSASSLAIQVLPNHSPTVSPTEVLIHRTGEETLLPIVINDEDGDELTVTLEGEDKALFEVRGDSLYYVGAAVSGLTVYQVTVVVADGVKTPVSVPVKVSVSENQVPTLTPTNINIRAKRRTASSYLLPIRISDPDGDKITSVVLSGSSEFSEVDGYIYFNATTTNTNALGDHNYTIYVTLTDELGASSSAIRVNVTVSVVSADISPSGAYAVADDIYYGEPLLNAFTRGAEVEGEWLMKRSSSVYYEDDAILPVGSYTFDLLFNPSQGNYRAEEVREVSFNVLPRAITLQSESASKIYDGTALSAPTVNLVEGSLVGDDHFLYSNFASLTKTGSKENTFDVTPAAGMVVSNYEVTKKYGTLTVEKRVIQDYEITLDANSFKYDGTLKQPTVTLTKDGETLDESLYTVSYKYNKDASDTALVVISGVENENVELRSDSARFSITKRRVVFESGSCEKEYDGEPLVCNQIKSISGDGVADGDTYTVNYTASITEVGSAKNTISVQFEGNNYVVFLSYGTLTVTPKSVTLTDENIVWSDNSFVYDKTAHCPTATITVDGVTLIPDVDYTISCENNVKVGDATVTVTALAGGNCHFTAYETTLPITPATIRVTEKSVAAKEYDALLNAVVAVDDFEGLYGGDQVGVVATGVFADANAGEHKQVTISYELTGDDKANYQLTPASEMFDEGVITAKEVSLVWDEPIEFTYDGTPKHVSASVVGTVGDESVHVIAYTGDQNVVAVGHYTTTAATLDSDNYRLPSDATVAWEIKKITEKPNIILSGAPFVYDRTAHQPSVTVKVGETVVDASDYAVEYKNNVNAGDTAMVIVSALAGDEHVYSFDQDTVYFSISKRAVAYTSPSASKEFDGTPLTEASCSPDDASSVLAGDEPTITYTGSQTNVGVSPNTFEVVFEPDNYEVTYHYGTLTVTPKDIVLAETDVVWDETEFIYDGQEHCPTSTITVGGLVLRPDEDYAIFCTNNVNVGTDMAHIAIRSASGGNFEFTDYEVNFSILPRKISVKDSLVESKVYDGTTSATVVVTAIDNAVAGDDIAIEASAEFEEEQAGASKTVAIQYSLSGDAKANYELLYDAATYTAGEITPRGVTLVWSEASLPFNGNTQSVEATVVTDLEGAVVHVVDYKDNSAAAVGTYTAKALTLDNTNFQLPENDSLVWQITEIEIHPTWYAVDGIYGTVVLGDNPKVTLDQPLAGTLLYKVDGVSFAEGDLLPAGSHVVSALFRVEAGFDIDCGSRTITVKKMTQEKPVITPIAESLAGMNDGKMIGLMVGMEVRGESGDFFAVEDADQLFAPGTYAVRWAGDDYKEASESAIVVILPGIAEFQVSLSSVDEQMGTVIGAGSYAHHSEVSIEATAMEGYHFDAWNGTITANPYTFVLEQDTTFVASFSPNSYTLTLKSDGAVLKSMEVHYGEVVTLAQLDTTPTKNGYEFAGWNQTFPLTIGAEDVVVEAKWNKKTYLLTLEAEHGAIAGEFTNPVPYMNVVVITAVPDEGYHFVMWKDGQTEEERVVRIVCDTTMIALFEPNQYQLSLMDDDMLLKTMSVTFGEEVTASILDYVPEKEGYDFDGWLPELPMVMGAADTELQAQWSKKNYHVTVKAEHATVDEFTSPVPFESSLELNVRPADGYHFASWSDGSLENPRHIVVVKDTVLEAMVAPNEYTLSLMDEDRVLKNLVVAYGESVTDALVDYVPEKTGYQFVGWTPRLPMVMGAADDTLVAEWGKRLFQITLDTIGAPGRVETDFENPIPFETVISMTAVPNVGYHFVAWSDGETQADRKMVVVKNDTLAPRFGRNEVEVLVVNLDEVVKRIPVLYGDSVTESMIGLSLEREGYDFVGWQPALPLVAGAENVTVEAVWSLKKIELTIPTVEHGAISSDFQNPVSYGDTISLTAVPDEGYHFVFWGDGEESNPRKIVVVDDTVPTPIFERNQYDLYLLADGDTLDVIPMMYGDTLTEVMVGVTPTKRGYEFVGWLPELPLVIGAEDLSIEAQWRIKTFEITMDSIFEHGKITFEYDEPIEYGDTITITAVPNEGYHFQSWSDGRRGNPREVVVKSDTSFIPLFALNSYTLMVMNEADTMRIYNFLYGDTVRHEILDRLMPTKVGHDFIGWDVQLPLFMPAHDTVIRAQYIPKIYTVITKINGNVGKVIGEGDYDYGTTAELTAVPNRGYHFVSWGDGDTTTSIRFTVSCDTIVSALFAKDVDEMMVDTLLIPALGYCPGTEDVMRYTLLTSEAPTEYRIVYDDEAKAAGFEDIDFSPIMADNEVRVVIPDCPAHIYKAKVQFRNAYGSLTPIFDVDVRVNLSSDFIIDIWSDVVSAVNLESRFVEYQWFHNDVKVGGANMPYYCEKQGLTGNYYMEVVTTEGEHLRTCKKWFNNAANTTLSVYPNPTEGIATVELSVDNGNTHNLKVTNSQGVTVYTTTFSGRKIQVDFGRFVSGTYIVDVDGLTVKEIRR